MTAPNRPAVELRCRCGTEGSPLRCIGSCGYLCQRLAQERDERP
jgi:hypothetical protein